MTRFCAPAAAVLRTVSVAVAVTVPAALGDAGLVPAQVVGAGPGLTTPVGGGGITHDMSGGVIVMLDVVAHPVVAFTNRIGNDAATARVPATGGVPDVQA